MKNFFAMMIVAMVLVGCCQGEETPPDTPVPTPSSQNMPPMD